MAENDRKDIVGIMSEIETVSLCKGYEKVIEELETFQKSFKNFRALEYAEFNVRVLAEEYMDMIRKNLVVGNVQTRILAARFAHNRSNYDIIAEAKKDPKKLQNDRYLEMLIKAMKDCVDSAFMLATHRQQTRQNANFEQLLVGQNIIQNSLQILVENIHQQPAFDVAYKHDVQPDPASTEHHQICLPVVPPTVTQVVVPTFQNGPLWLVSQAQCQNLYSINIHSADGFTKKFLLKLYSSAEILLPLRYVPTEKKAEFLQVAAHFYPNEEINWEEKYHRIMKNQRFQKRRHIFNGLYNKTGYCITSKDVNFWYLRPLSDQTQFFSNKYCRIGTQLATKSFGEIKIPEKCGDFEYIIFVEKPGRNCNIQMLFRDGRLIRI
uniref:Uncharacterized protein n=1 Tax=Panagrolaimus davidi TaxID=227884 RepID=A0A914PL25_9BILA